MSGFNFRVAPPPAAIAHLARRVLIATGVTKGAETIPIGPTGYGYLTYVRFPTELHYSNRVVTSDKRLFVAGQLHKELPYFKVNGPLFQIGLELHPQVLYYLFGIPGPDVLDNSLILPEVDPQMADYLPALDQEEDPDKVAGILSNILLEKEPVHEPIQYVDEAIDQMLDSGGTKPITELTGSLGVSQRNFSRVFQKVIGLSPKRYSKVVQFNRAFEAIMSGNHEAIQDVAAACGYYDQSHFVNDFQRHLGQSPGAFLNGGHDFLKDYLGKYR